MCWVGANLTQVTPGLRTLTCLNFIWITGFIKLIYGNAGLHIECLITEYPTNRYHCFSSVSTWLYNAHMIRASLMVPHISICRLHTPNFEEFVPVIFLIASYTFGYLAHKIWNNVKLIIHYCFASRKPNIILWIFSGNRLCMCSITRTVDTTGRDNYLCRLGKMLLLIHA